MNELHSILHAWRAAAAEERPGVLVTVVHVRGSAYRRPGARMLLLPDGRRWGSISGGCLEGDLTQKAWWLTESGRPVLRVYDTTSEDDAVWEFGLGCNGIVEVLLERLDAEPVTEALEFLDHCRSNREEAVVATVIRTARPEGAQVGDRLLVDSRGLVSGGALRQCALGAELLPHVEAAFRERRSCLVHAADTQVFVEWIGPPLPLVIFGAGHDAVPLTAMACEMGWNITVADGRPAFARRERFPGIDRVVLQPAEDPLAGLEIGPDTAVLLMTHNYPRDEQLLRRILPLRPRYLGVLGPRVRAERLLTDLGLPDYPEALHAPAGLDIGADSPAAIALAIVAEIQAAFSQREGGMLRLRSGPIYAPVAEVRADAAACRG